ncbi:hypothetical protein PGT21_020491 [Puccinia graminis f. sp. tritici]|uniref:Uncharacterized protein n=1 Tax=Puccinia graminis f. sp. tritici TaxID=56615 RepID=A0A5B0QNI3_PUCGR|nr:hypothetical protein PGT21_020491 [Puccinia graminis f. sp. tritici]
MLPLNYNNIPPIPPPIDCFPAPQIFGWLEIHSISPQIIAHDPSQHSSQDMVLFMDKTNLNCLTQQIQITSQIWISGLIVRSDPKFIYISVDSFTYNPPSP